MNWFTENKKKTISAGIAFILIALFNIGHVLFIFIDNELLYTIGSRVLFIIIIPGAILMILILFLFFITFIAFLLLLFRIILLRIWYTIVPIVMKKLEQFENIMMISENGDDMFKLQEQDRQTKLYLAERRERIEQAKIRNRRTTRTG